MTQDIRDTRIHRQPTWVGLVRIALGFLLTWKGLAFIHDISQLEVFLDRSGGGELSGIASFTAATIGIVTLLSGIFISVGLFTRPIAFVQLIIVGAALIFLSAANINRSTIDVIFSFIVLVLLVYYGIHGSGKISFDQELTQEVQSV